eukprot:11210581-Lingulodinium_polyedra.AAC.1
MVRPDIVPSDPRAASRHHGSVTLSRVVSCASISSVQQIICLPPLLLGEIVGAGCGSGLLVDAPGAMGDSSDGPRF